ncbi:MAG: hypothetical protein CMN76_10695 [Spirochaetaceae bacterium]|nr:hypothetical protein [Spirochaetaceae bacterium]
MPYYSGRQVRLQCIPVAGGLRIRLSFSGRLDHAKATSGSWERKPQSALWIQVQDNQAAFAPDLLTLSGPLQLRIQAMGERSVYIDLYKDGGLMFSGKAEKSLWAWRWKLLPGGYGTSTIESDPAMIKGTIQTCSSKSNDSNKLNESHQPHESRKSQAEPGGATQGSMRRSVSGAGHYGK